MKKIMSVVIIVALVVIGIGVCGIRHNATKSNKDIATNNVVSNNKKETDKDDEKEVKEVQKTKEVKDAKKVKEVKEVKEKVKLENMQMHNFKTTYGLIVKIAEQKVYVYKKDKLVKTMVCSTGVKGKDTPVGNFQILRKQTKFYSQKYQQGGFFWLEFIKGGQYLFHSVPFDKTGKIIKEEEKKLGQKASHGCVRISVENAKWLYNNIPSGTKVIIEAV